MLLLLLHRRRDEFPLLYNTWDPLLVRAWERIGRSPLDDLSEMGWMTVLTVLAPGPAMPFTTWITPPGGAGEVVSGPGLPGGGTTIGTPSPPQVPHKEVA